MTVNTIADYLEVELSNTDECAKVDPEDFEKVSRYSWHKHKAGHAKGSRRVKGKLETLYMHRVIMDAPKGSEVDHINHDPLDNRKANLRVVDKKRNAWNRKIRFDNKTGFKGVFYDEKRKVYVATFRNKAVGYYKTAKEAAEHYDRMAKENYDEYAWLNFPVKK